MENIALDVIVSVKDFGAKGDSIADDTVAIKKALRESANTFFPAGVYNITSSLEIRSDQCVFGEGDNSIVKAIGFNYDVFQVIENNSIIRDIKIIGGDVGIKVLGNQNKFSNIDIYRSQTHGILLTLVEDNAIPQENDFSNIKINSDGEDTQGYGIFLQNANNNKFKDIEIKIYDGANACVRLSEAENTKFINLYTEIANDLEDVLLDEESKNISMINHTYKLY